MSNLVWLTETQMAHLRPFFPKSHGRPRVDDMRVLSSIIFINRNDLRRCDGAMRRGNTGRRRRYTIDRNIGATTGSSPGS